MWWRGEDSNLRRLSQQIYSLPPLAAREPLHIPWSQRRESNPRPTDYKSVALPSELRWHHKMTKFTYKPPNPFFQVFFNLILGTPLDIQSKDILSPGPGRVLKGTPCKRPFVVLGTLKRIPEYFTSATKDLHLRS